MGGYFTPTPNTPISTSDHNTYVRDQTVNQFASAAARSSAITAPSEGMVSYRNDADANAGAVEVYDSTAWLPLALAQPPRCIVARTTNQSISNNTVTAISWDSEVLDPDGLIAVTATTVTIARAGVYLLTAGATFTNNGTGDRLLLLNVGGSELVGGGNSAPASVTNTTRMNAAQCIVANASDAITVSVLQTSGGALNLTGARLSVIRLSL